MAEFVDVREGAYQDLHHGQLAAARETNAHSARTYLGILKEYVDVHSMLDIGCGLGTWLKVGQEMGMEVQGLEGPWSDQSQLEIDPKLVTITDLEKPIDLGKKFDLAISLEVGEHLSADAAPHLVNALTSHADHVMFSAAIPFQGGHHHINEQFHSYWIELFEQRGFIPLDIFRARTWKSKDLHWWLAQNLLLFASKEAVAKNPKLKAESEIQRPLDIVHPDIYLARMARAQQKLQILDRMVKRGGTFRVVQTPQGPSIQPLD